MPRKNDLPELETLLEFQEVYLRAVELSWRDDCFKEKFIENPVLALSNYFGYVFPWGIELKVEEAKRSDDCGWLPEYPGGKSSWKLPSIGVTVGIPEKPDEPDQQALAWACYNDAGPTYLFSCC